VQERTREEWKRGLAEETGIEWIDRTETLAALCKRLAAHPFVTVDTEFMRETTYYPKLCLVQIASEAEVALIDPLAPGIDLAPFFALMANQSVVKVFHAARQDIETFWNIAQAIPAPLFDTQVAAMVCGFGDQIGYEAIASSLAGAKIDKSSRFTDWSKRPLSEAQFAYAAADVTHLRVVYTRLQARLEKTGRSNWVSEEMAILTDPETYRADPERAWERLRNRARKPRDLAVLMELAAWREREAQIKDVPRGRILKDDVLGELVLAAPKNLQAMAQMRGLPNGFERSRSAADLVEAIQRGLARPLSDLPPIAQRNSMSNGAAALMQLLKVLLQAASDRHQVAAKIIATSEDLEELAESDSLALPCLIGWRAEVFGNEALALKNGALALTVRGGRVRTVAIDQPDSSSEPALRTR
jgi:ribonuclease D